MIPKEDDKEDDERMSLLRPVEMNQDDVVIERAGKDEAKGNQDNEVDEANRPDDKRQLKDTGSSFTM